MSDSTRTLKVFQQGFNYSQDGRGNRLVLHLQGCNMHCPWCSNPEGMPTRGALMTEKEWLTESSCPKGAVRNGLLDRSLCENCADIPCTGLRQKGIRLSCKDYPVEELADRCARSAPMFFDGGGVTLTGGEISLQFDAVRELLILLGERGIHRAIETNGSHPHLGELIPLVDQWIMDIKHYDDETHRKWTGVSNRQVLENLAIVAARHRDVLLRIPLIPGFNSAPEDAEGFAKVLEPHIRGKMIPVELLSYHEFGKIKWAQCGKPYTMPPEKISPETVAHFERVLNGHGITCIHT